MFLVAHKLSWLKPMRERGIGGLIELVLVELPVLAPWSRNAMRVSEDEGDLGRGDDSGSYLV
jgi:hypothetical protein